MTAQGTLKSSFCSNAGTGLFYCKHLKKGAFMVQQMQKMALIIGLSQIALAVMLFYSMEIRGI